MADETNRSHWDSLGARYSANWSTPGQQLMSDKETSFVVDHLPARSGLTVLDVGIGNGRILERLLDDDRVEAVYGVDVAAEMVSVCREKFGANPKIRDLVVCDVATEALPIPVKLDFISAIRVLKYSANWWEMVAQTLLPQLAPNGVLVFSMPNANSVKRFSRPYAVPYFNTTEKELRERLSHAGAEVVSLSGFSKIPDAVYRASTRPALTRSLLAVERSLDGVVGSTRLARELFVAAKRTT
jgi:SAM-dependent methyltransferase